MFDSFEERFTSYLDNFDSQTIGVASKDLNKAVKDEPADKKPLPKESETKVTFIMIQKSPF